MEKLALRTIKRANGLASAKRIHSVHLRQSIDADYHIVRLLGSRYMQQSRAASAACRRPSSIGELLTVAYRASTSVRSVTDLHLIRPKVEIEGRCETPRPARVMFTTVLVEDPDYRVQIPASDFCSHLSQLLKTTDLGPFEHGAMKGGFDTPLDHGYTSSVGLDPRARRGKSTPFGFIFLKFKSFSKGNNHGQRNDDRIHFVPLL